MNIKKVPYPYKFSPTLIILCFLMLSIFLFPLFSNRNKVMPENTSELLFSQGSFLIPTSNPANPPLKVVRVMNKTIITAYSSTSGQTDDSPFITASNKRVEDGIVANNYLDFGTKIRIPELYGDKIFVVEDRMNRRKGNYHFDIWFQNYEEALTFGAERTYIEVLGR